MSASPHDVYPAAVPSVPRTALRANVFRGKPASSVTMFPARPVSEVVVPKVALDAISLSYKTTSGERLLALDNVSLEVKPGEFLCIVGPSGCGKSTLLHLIAGLQPQTSGRILVDGAPVSGPGTDRILIFQELGLFPWLTVGGNVEFGMKMKNVSKAEREEKVQYYLRLVHLLHFRDSYIHQLSGGMLQRVALARALATEPDVLLMDEPFGALDVQTKAMMSNELLGLWEQTRPSVIFVTHDLEEAIALADQVVLMTAGPGTVKAVYDIDLPRPRGAVQEIRFAPRFLELHHQIWESLREEVEAAYSRTAVSSAGGRP